VPKRVVTPEPPPFLRGPESDPELAPLFDSLTSDPPGRLELSIESDPPPPLRAEIRDEAPAVHAFDLAPPATSPSLPKISAPEEPPTEPPEAAPPDQREGDERALTPTKLFAMRPPPREVDLGDIDLDNLESTGPAPLLAGESEQTLQFSKPPLDPSWRVESEPPVTAAGPQPATPAPQAGRPRPASAGRRVLAWAIDACVLALWAAGNALLAAAVIGSERLAPAGAGSLDYWLDLLLGRRLLPLWLSLFGCQALLYSWLFAAVGGRTPGLLAMGLRLVPLRGERVPPLRALARAALSVLAAVPALFGFALALFDPRGQALQDKLTDTMVVRNEPLAPQRAFP
jgi:uncharacterized RDD family membrane protein YckC